MTAHGARKALELESFSLLVDTIMYTICQISYFPASCVLPSSMNLFCKLPHLLPFHSTAANVEVHCRVLSEAVGHGCIVTLGISLSSLGGGGVFLSVL